TAQFLGVAAVLFCVLDGQARWISSAARALLELRARARPASGISFRASRGLLCESCRRPGMRPLGKSGRELAGVLAGKRLDELEISPELRKTLQELREASLDWIEHHVERRLLTREFLETT